MAPTITNDTGVDDACAAASTAAPMLRGADRTWRAGLLETIAAALETARHDIVAIADDETRLGTTRLGGELTRTVYQ
jgi:NADP-dependent aldehyde dehydrogenase